MRKAEFTVGVGLMLLGVGLPLIGVSGTLVGTFVTGVGFVMCLVGCREWIFGEAPATLGDLDDVGPLTPPAIRRVRADRGLHYFLIPDDTQCVRSEAGTPREYRVKIVNASGGPAHGVHVRIEELFQS